MASRKAIFPHEDRGMHATQQASAVSPEFSSTLPSDPATFAGAIRRLTLAGPAGELEAVLNQGAPECAVLPRSSVIRTRWAAAIMHNKVVYHAMKVLNDAAWGLGWPVLRFNFRGTGLSEGVHDGIAETGDVLAGMDWLEREFRLPLVVAGFSFGAAMALRAC